MPEELLTDDIRDLQLWQEVDDHTGFEYAPGSCMPALLFTTSNTTGRWRRPGRTWTRCSRWSVVHERMWKVLGGHLFFDGSPVEPNWGQMGIEGASA